MELSVEAFVRLLASEDFPSVEENELRADIRAAMREQAENQIRDALASAIKAGRLEVRSLIARVPFGLAPSAAFNPLDWLMGDDSQTAARALLGRPGPQSVESSAPISSTQVSGEPVPLTTGDMAALLDGIERTEAKWLRMLGDCPKWLEIARVSKGAPGRAAAAWNPVNAALALQSRQAPATKLRALFKHPLAAHWADEWARVNQAADDAAI